MTQIKETKIYLFSYYHDGYWWSFQIAAYNKEDAVSRINKLPLAKYDGELIMEIPLVSKKTFNILSKIKHLLGLK